MIEIISSHLLTQDNQAKLEQVLSKKFDSSDFNYSIDKDLALGIVIRHKNIEYYYNLRFELTHILQQLLN